MYDFLTFEEVNTARKKMATRKVWTHVKEQSFIELWQEHESLYDVSHEMFHNRSEKENFTKF